MKEATGELNATVIVIVAIGVLSAFFYLTIWPLIRSNMQHNSMCKKAWCDKEPLSDGKTVNCHLKDSDEIIVCPWKNVKN